MGLTVAVFSSFVARWLVPRLQDFVAAYPNVQLHFLASNTLPLDTAIEDMSERLLEFAQRPIDLSIRYGVARADAENERLLGTDAAYPVCSPALAATLKEPRDVLKHRLLQDVLPEDWTMWLAAANVAQTPSIGMVFSHARDMLDAAETGLGVALGHDALVSDALRSGRLVRPFDISIPACHSYYLARLPRSRGNAAADAFEAWIVEAVAKTNRK
jgi:DNA-binding transcriptional LysR family regulator